MASNPIANSSREIATLSTTLSTLLNRDLQNICQSNGLNKSGVKAELQRRIVNALNETIHSDQRQYCSLRAAIQMASNRGPKSNGSAAAGRGGGFHGFGGNHLPPPHVSAYGQNGYGGYGQPRGGYGGTGAHASPKRVLHFKNSPFYTIESMIGDVKTCTEMPQHRNSVQITLKTNEFPQAYRFSREPNLRVMLLCSDDDQGVQDITFPHQSELKVNGGDVKANLRGLKNKPGSTRPADITNALRLDKSSYVNNIELTYALTQRVSKKSDHKPPSQKYHVALYVCKISPVQDLVTRIKDQKIPKTSVIRELNNKAQDPDVIATSQVLSLRCPLTYMRLNVPCRSTSCSHIQCFDGTSYLQLQEQGPQWLCPICNKSAPFESLAIDEYVKDILDNTFESTEQVIIEPDGQWKAQTTGEPEPKKPRYSGATTSILDDEDDDVVPLDDFDVSARTTQTPNRSMIGTPASIGAPAANGSGSKKRPAEVIDLTLSDDDDEPIVRAPKRQNPGPTPTPVPAQGLSYPHFDYSR